MFPWYSIILTYWSIFSAKETKQNDFVADPTSVSYINYGEEDQMVSILSVMTFTGLQPLSDKPLFFICEGF
jgi:hypothetical protein